MRIFSGYVTVFALVLIGSVRADEFSDFCNTVKSLKDAKELSLRALDARKEFVDTLNAVKNEPDIASCRNTLFRVIKKSEIIAARLAELPEPSEYEKREIAGFLNRREIELFGFKSPLEEATKNWIEEWKKQFEAMMSEVMPRIDAIEAVLNRYSRDAPSTSRQIRSGRLNLRDGYVAILSIMALDRLGGKEVKNTKMIRMEVLHNPDAIENTVLYDQMVDVEDAGEGIFVANLKELIEYDMKKDVAKFKVGDKTITYVLPAKK